MSSPVLDFTTAQLARIEQAEALAANAKAPNFPENEAQFKLAFYDIGSALANLATMSARARVLRSERNAFQSDFVAAADDAQLNNQIGVKLLGRVRGGIERLASANPERANLVTRRMQDAPGDSIRAVRDAVDDAARAIRRSGVGLTEMGLEPELLVQADLLEENYKVLFDGVQVAGTTRAAHTQKLHAELDQLDTLINTIDKVCNQLEQHPDVGYRPVSYDMGILKSAAAGNGPAEAVDLAVPPTAQQVSSSNAAGLPPLTPEGNSETGGLPPLAPLGEG